MTDDSARTPPDDPPPGPRIGRPKRAAGEGRAAVIALRVTEVERAEIEARAARSGLSLSDYCRRVLLKHRVRAATAKTTQTDAAVLVEMNRIGVNLNQIARNANRGQGIPIDLAETLAEVRALIERLAMEQGE